MSYKLEKPYTDKQRADFICEHQGMVPVETGNALYFLEDYEELQNDSVVNISESEDYQNCILEKQKSVKKAEIQAQLDELDLRSIRALREGGIKDEITGQTWLEYYTAQIISLREEMDNL